VTEAISRLQRKLKASAGLLTVGLVAEAVTLYWSNPLSFLFFIGIGGLLVGIGIAMYLIAVVSE